MTPTPSNDRPTGKPWYREPWPWFLMAGPAAVVVAGLATFWIAVDTQDGLVSDDYYRRGLAVNQTLRRNERAKELRLGARVRLNGDAVLVELSAPAGASMPERLVLTLAHPTRAGLDQVIPLSSAGGAFRGVSAPISTGRWNAVIEDEAKTWRLAGVIQLPGEGELRAGAGGPGG